MAARAKAGPGASVTITYLDGTTEVVPASWSSQAGAGACAALAAHAAIPAARPLARCHPRSLPRAPTLIFALCCPRPSSFPASLGGAAAAKSNFGTVLEGDIVATEVTT